jgi:hypothetical protein
MTINDRRSHRQPVDVLEEMPDILPTFNEFAYTDEA